MSNISELTDAQLQDIVTNITMLRQNYKSAKQKRRAMRQHYHQRPCLSTEKKPDPFSALVGWHKIMP